MTLAGMSTDLVRYEAARTALAEALAVDEVKDIRDRAIALATYARLARDGELVAHATEIRLRAERRAGEMLVESPKAEGAKGNPGGRGAPIVRSPEGTTHSAAPPTLTDLGVTKRESARWQGYAKLPESEFEGRVESAKKEAMRAIEGSKAERTAAKQERRAEREAELGAKQIALPARKFGVILADCEWRFEPRSRETGLDRAADNHYPTSALETIATRPVASIAADDAVLFLWATAPMMPEALYVMGAWDFDYKSSCIWAKPHAGTGYWFRNQHELLLVGTRGNIPCPAMGLQWPSIVMAPLGDHSEKPDKFYELIEAYFPTLPKLELNARRSRKNWTAWGYEAPIDEVL